MVVGGWVVGVGVLFIGFGKKSERCYQGLELDFVRKVTTRFFKGVE